MARQKVTKYKNSCPYCGAPMLSIVAEDNHGMEILCEVHCNQCRYSFCMETGEARFIPTEEILRSLSVYETVQAGGLEIRQVPEWADRQVRDFSETR